MPLCLGARAYCKICCKDASDAPDLASLTPENVWEKELPNVDGADTEHEQRLLHALLEGTHIDGIEDESSPIPMEVATPRYVFTTACLLFIVCSRRRWL